MKGKFGVFVVALVFCVFMGVTAISMGVGAVVPSVNLIARPFVCPNGQMTSDSQRYNPHPGKTVLSRTWQCVDAGSGSKTPLSTFLIALYSGTIYGLMLFALLFFVILTKAKRPASSAGQGPHHHRQE